MARYIDAEDLKAVIRANDWSNPVVPDVVCVIIDRTPTANVAPMEEVKRLHTSCTELAQCCTKFETLYKIECKRVDTIKADTVRKMEDLFDKYFCHDPAFLVVEQRLIMDIIDQIAKETLEDST